MRKDNAPVLQEVTPSLPRRLISIVYESFLLAAVLFLVDLVFLLVVRALGGPIELYQPNAPVALRVLQAVLLGGVLWGYFGYCWTTSGQTLAMKTWKIEVLDLADRRLKWKQASIRFAIALAGTAFFGATYVWALFDRDGQFMHDRLAGTKQITFKRVKTK
ncbi:RDD family protein [Leeia oryzae]|uniref:RDD family protein n=1 Tax=Leeia oryzae TaxID=356662 RepID=UPI0003661D45|nr:RDD family protein [Leeia oryzae]